MKGKGERKIYFKSSRRLRKKVHHSTFKTESRGKKGKKKEKMKESSSYPMFAKERKKKVEL